MAIRRTIRTIFFILLGFSFASSAMAQLAAQWHGTWKSVDGKTTLTISPTHMIIQFKVEDEPEKFRDVRTELKWSDAKATESLEEETFGESNKTMSPADIARIFESAVRQKQAGDQDFSVSDPVVSRQAIKSIAPGLHKVMWSYAGGDCGYSEYIFDKDRMLELSQCKYDVSVSLFKRKK